MDVPEVAFSMWQPWASLVVLGYKGIETRSWAFPMKYEGKRVAVHAGKRPINPEEIGEIEDALGGPLPIDINSLAHGCLIGSVVLGRVHGLWGEPDGPLNWKGGVVIAGVGRLERTPVSRQELAFGNYEDGRFGWMLDSPECFEKPIAFRGLQGFFSTRYEVAVRGPVARSLFDEVGESA